MPNWRMWRARIKNVFEEKFSPKFMAAATAVAMGVDIILLWNGFRGRLLLGASGAVACVSFLIVSRLVERTLEHLRERHPR